MHRGLSFYINLYGIRSREFLVTVYSILPLNFWFLIAINCHQALEFRLKAIYIQVFGKGPKKTHSLWFLLRAIGEKLKIEICEDYIPFLVQLTQVYNEGRYEKDYSPEKQEALATLALTEEVLEWSQTL
jgi:HEPN domain-containing protein